MESLIGVRGRKRKRRKLELTGARASGCCQAGRVGVASAPSGKMWVWLVYRGGVVWGGGGV